MSCVSQGIQFFHLHFQIYWLTLVHKVLCLFSVGKIYLDVPFSFLVVFVFTFWLFILIILGRELPILLAFQKNNIGFVGFFLYYKFLLFIVSVFQPSLSTILFSTSLSSVIKPVIFFFSKTCISYDKFFP